MEKIVNNRILKCIMFVCIVFAILTEFGHLDITGGLNVKAEDTCSIGFSHGDAISAICYSPEKGYTLALKERGNNTGYSLNLKLHDKLIYYSTNKNIKYQTKNGPVDSGCHAVYIEITSDLIGKNIYGSSNTSSNIVGAYYYKDPSARKKEYTYIPFEQFDTTDENFIGLSVTEAQRAKFIDAVKVYSGSECTEYNQTSMWNFIPVKPNDRVELSYKALIESSGYYKESAGKTLIVGQEFKAISYGSDALSFDITSKDPQNPLLKITTAEGGQLGILVDVKEITIPKIGTKNAHFNRNNCPCILRCDDTDSMSAKCYINDTEYVDVTGSILPAMPGQKIAYNVSEKGIGVYDQNTGEFKKYTADEGFEYAIPQNVQGIANIETYYDKQNKLTILDFAVATGWIKVNQAKKTLIVDLNNGTNKKYVAGTYSAITYQRDKYFNFDESQVQPLPGYAKYGYSTTKNGSAEKIAKKDIFHGIEDEEATIYVVWIPEKVYCDSQGAKLYRYNYYSASSNYEYTDEIVETDERSSLPIALKDGYLFKGWAQTPGAKEAQWKAQVIKLKENNGGQTFSSEYPSEIRVSGRPSEEDLVLWPKQSRVATLYPVFEKETDKLVNGVTFKRYLHYLTNCGGGYAEWPHGGWPTQDSENHWSKCNYSEGQKDVLTKITFSTKKPESYTTSCDVSEGAMYRKDSKGCITAYFLEDKAEVVIYSTTGKIHADRDMSHMFEGFGYLREVDFGNLDTSEVTDMSYLFNASFSAHGDDITKVDLDITPLDMSKVTNVMRMFSYNYNVRAVNLSAFDFSKYATDYHLVWTDRMQSNHYYENGIFCEPYSMGNSVDIIYTPKKVASSTQMDLNSVFVDDKGNTYTHMPDSATAPVIYKKSVYGDRGADSPAIPDIPWDDPDKHYTIHFDARGGQGTMDDITIKYNDTYKLPKCTFVKEDLKFVGWSLKPDAELIFKDEDTVKRLSSINEDVVTLYAVWLRGQEVIVDADIDPSYTVILPAMLTLNKNRFADKPKYYAAGYPITVQGTIYAEQFVNVIPVETDNFILKDVKGNRKCKPFIHANGVSWSADELEQGQNDGISKGSMIEAQIPKAGIYSGEIIYSFSLSDKEEQNKFKDISMTGTGVDDTGKLIKME